MSENALLLMSANGPTGDSRSTNPDHAGAFKFKSRRSLPISALSSRIVGPSDPGGRLRASARHQRSVLDFLVRPLGAFVFGWLGDRVGRKYTFIMTLVGMALGTGAIGLIPTFEQIGLAAAKGV
jgi:hypothetical protein